MEEDTITTVSKRLSKALSLIESCDVNELEWYFSKHPDYNDEVRYRLRDAARLLGYALATFTTWDEDLESSQESLEKNEPACIKVYWKRPNRAVEAYLGSYSSLDDAAYTVSCLGEDTVNYRDIISAWEAGKYYDMGDFGSFRALGSTH